MNLPKTKADQTMSNKKKGLPESEKSVEKIPSDFLARTWTRKRWRKRHGEDVVRCASCGTTLNRADTYYVRPAYTDGEEWLCSGCYDRLTDRADIDRDHRYGHRGNEAEPD